MTISNPTFQTCFANLRAGPIGAVRPVRASPALREALQAIPADLEAFLYNGGVRQ